MFEREELQPGEYTSISGWLRGQTSYNAFHFSAQPKINLQAGGFVAIDRSVPVYQAGEVPAQSLEEAWHTVRQYVEEACELVHAGDECPRLDKDEIDMILTGLGRPPPPCYPVYFIAVRDRASEEERLVYVGKTSSSSNRFSGGHAALTKLHDPLYDGTDKVLYLGTVMLQDIDNEYLPLEAVQPLEKAKAMLVSIEAQLIYELKPELNTQGRARDNTRSPLNVIHIQNSISKFLQNTFVFR
jgi:hypothetical protein